MKKLAHEWNITIDAEFESVNRKLSPEEQDLLETDLESGGCRDDLVIWQHNGQRILLDGHYRYRACLTLGVPFGVIALSVASRAEAMAWIKINQRARRNCTPEEISYLRGKQHNDQKLSRGAQEGNRNAVANESDTVSDLPTSERIAANHGVSARTVERDAAFARAADTVAANAGHEALASILAGELGSKKDIQALAGLPPDEQREAVAGGKPGVQSAVSGAPGRAPKRKSGPQPKLDLAAVQAAFLGLCEEDRMAFLDWIDSEVFEARDRYAIQSVLDDALRAQRYVMQPVSN